MTNYLVYKSYMKLSEKIYVPMDDLMEDIEINLNERPLVGERIFVKGEWKRIVEILHKEDSDTILVV